MSQYAGNRRDAAPSHAGAIVKKEAGAMEKQIDMRSVYIEELAAMMDNDPRILIIDADLAKAMGTLKLYGKYRERIINVGIAEQNMISVAAGLAAYGDIPVTGTFSAFASRRVCDQIAISVGFAKNNVKMFGADPGITAQLNGATHMANEDIGSLRSIPNLIICEPCDAASLRSAMKEILYCDAPVYVRLNRKVAPDIYEEQTPFDMYKAVVLRSGNDVTLFSSGIEVAEALRAADLLQEQGICAEVLDVHTIKPIDKETIVASARKTKCAVSCENHNVLGGLGSAISEVLVANCPITMEFIGVQDHIGEASPIDYLIKKYHMTAKDIVEAALKVIKRKESEGLEAKL